MHAQITVGIQMLCELFCPPKRHQILLFTFCSPLSSPPTTFFPFKLAFPDDRTTPDTGSSRALQPPVKMPPVPSHGLYQLEASEKAQDNVTNTCTPANVLSSALAPCLYMATVY